MGTPINSAREGLNITQAAERVGVHHQTIRNWIHAGKLPVTRFGTQIVRIHPDDLDALRQGPNGSSPPTA